MNVLERWAAEEFTRVPVGPSPDDLRRRVRVRRARRAAASLAALALVSVVAGIAVSQRSPDRRVEVVGPTTPTTLPIATTAEFPPLARIVRMVREQVSLQWNPAAGSPRPDSVEIVEVSRAEAEALEGGSPSRTRYFVQVIGDFVCRGCSGIGSPPPHGSVLQLSFGPSGYSTAFGIGGNHPADLAAAGTVYRLPL